MMIMMMMMMLMMMMMTTTSISFLGLGYRHILFVNGDDMVTFFSSEVAGDPGDPVMSRIFCRFHWEQQRETVTICDRQKSWASSVDTYGICSSHPNNAGISMEFE